MTIIIGDEDSVDKNSEDNADGGCHEDKNEDSNRRHKRRL